MNNRQRCLCLVIIAAVFFVAAANPFSTMATIAMVTKVVQDVSKKIAAANWTKAQKGDPLSSGDEIKTGEKSIAVVKFKDNSIVRVREKAELKLQGETTGGAFSKTVFVNRGTVGFEVQKQGNEKFTFTSPTSVASIRGTKGMMETAATGDELVVTEGLVNLLNLISNRSVNVGAGQTGVSRDDGTINARQSTPQERDRALNALASGDDSRQNELKIELRDPQGNTKELKIRYRD